MDQIIKPTNCRGRHRSSSPDSARTVVLLLLLLLLLSVLCCELHAMSKVSKLSKIKKGAERVIHTTPLKLWIQSGMAAPGPPLGPQLGQVRLEQFLQISVDSLLSSLKLRVSLSLLFREESILVSFARSSMTRLRI